MSDHATVRDHLIQIQRRAIDHGQYMLIDAQADAALDLLSAAPKVTDADQAITANQMRSNRNGAEIAVISPAMVREVVGILWLQGYAIVPNGRKPRLGWPDTVNEKSL